MNNDCLVIQLVKFLLEEGFLWKTIGGGKPFVSLSSDLFSVFSLSFFLKQYMTMIISKTTNPKAMHGITTATTGNGGFSGHA